MTLDAGSIVLAPSPDADLSAARRHPVQLLTGGDERGGSLVAESRVRTNNVVNLRQAVLATFKGWVDETTRAHGVWQLCQAFHRVA